MGYCEVVGIGDGKPSNDYWSVAHCRGQGFTLAK